MIASYRYVCRSRFDAVKLQDGTTVLFLVYVTNYFTILFIFTIRSYVPSNLTSLTSLYATYIYTASFSSFFILGTFFSDSFHGRGMDGDEILRVSSGFHPLRLASFLASSFSTCNIYFFLFLRGSRTVVEGLRDFFSDFHIHRVPR